MFIVEMQNNLKCQNYIEFCKMDPIPMKLSSIPVYRTLDLRIPTISLQRPTISTNATKYLQISTITTNTTNYLQTPTKFTLGLFDNEGTF